MPKRRDLGIQLLLSLIILGTPGIFSGVFPGVSKLEAAPLPDSRVLVYQFHRRFRCEACHTLEAAIRETFKAHFQEELGSGELVFKVVDLDAEGNGHYAADYDFTYNTVIVVDVEKGIETRFKNLEEAWSLIGTRDALKEFIRSHVEEYLTS